MCLAKSEQHQHVACMPEECAQYANLCGVMAE